MIKITPGYEFQYIQWNRKWNNHGSCFEIDYGYKNNVASSVWIEVDELIPITEFEKHKNNVIENSDKVYFTKTSTIPRYKIKEYLDTNNIILDKTNRIAYGTAYVIGFSQLKDAIYGNCVKHNLSLYKIPIKDILNLNCGESIHNMIKSYPEVNYVILHEPYDYSNNKSSYPFDLDQYEKFNGKLLGLLHGDNKIIETIRVYNHFVNILDKVKIIFDETLLETCNKGTTIDEEVYRNLKSMLESNDQSNHNVAMEIIANSDYVESKFYILFLLCSHWKYPLSHAPKTTNYLSCLKYFEKYKNLYQSGWQKLASELITKECKTENDFNILKQFILDKINNGLAFKGSSFKLKNIEI